MSRFKKMLLERIDKYISNYIAERVNSISSSSSNSNNLVTLSNITKEEPKEEPKEEEKEEPKEEPKEESKEESKEEENDLFYVEMDNTVPSYINIDVINKDILSACKTDFKYILDIFNTILINYFNHENNNKSLFSLMYVQFLNINSFSVELNLVPKNRVFIQHKILLHIKRNILNVYLKIKHIYLLDINANANNLETIRNQLIDINAYIHDNLLSNLDKLISTVDNYIENNHNLINASCHMLTDDIYRIYKETVDLYKSALAINTDARNNITSITINSTSKERLIDSITTNKYNLSTDLENSKSYIDKSCNYLTNCKNTLLEYNNSDKTNKNHYLAKLVANAEDSFNYALLSVKSSANAIMSSSINIQIENNINIKDRDFVFEDNLLHQNLRSCLDTFDKIHSFALQ
jgi:hypothetical protein